tara:strand:- start:272 stop:463 length:192 start_codon:yes stop_codon:yes gene_type:complete
MKNILIAAITVTLLSGNSSLAARFCLDFEPGFATLVNKPSLANPILNISKPSCQLNGQKPNID